MKSLFVMRHAKSSWAEAHQRDHDRPLNERGERTAPRMGTFLREQNATPDLILSSSATRAQRTAQMVAEAAEYGGEITVMPSLYDADPNAYLFPLTLLDDGVERVLMVGHNPTLESLIFLLTDQVEEMPTAAIAHIELDIGAWADVGADTKGQLAGLWRPKEVLQDRTAE